MVMQVGVDMNKVAYMPRVYDNLLEWRLQTKGAVLVEGPKWCGKTSTCLQQAKSVVYMQDPENRAAYLTMAELEPSTLLTGSTPRLIDEWQMAPSLWDSVRHLVDQRGELGQFILTGSATPPDFTQMQHSGAGRITKLHMHTMSLLESKESTGSVSLGSLFKREDLSNASSFTGTLEEMAYLICRGGWPQAVKMKGRAALQQAFDYVDVLCETDITRTDNTSRNPQVARALLRSYARHVGAKAPLKTVFSDVRETLLISDETLRTYVSALESLFVVEDLLAWNPNLRSKTAIRTTPTRYFTDPSIAAAALGASPDSLLTDLETFGLLFENLCVRDLRIYAQVLDGRLFFYRDKNNLECDAILELRDGSYGLIEIKLGGERLIEEGSNTLNKLLAKLNTEKIGEPAFKMVLVAKGEQAYRRKDGVLVVPIRALGV